MCVVVLTMSFYFLFYNDEIEIDREDERAKNDKNEAATNHPSLLHPIIFVKKQDDEMIHVR